MSVIHISKSINDTQDSGYAVNARLAPISWFLYISQPIDNSINAIHVLQQGYEFINCYVLPESVEGASESYGEAAAISKKFIPQFFIPGDSSYLQQQLKSLSNEPMILLYDDGGQTLQFGSEKVPFYLSSINPVSGTGYEGKKGVEVKGVSVHRYFYNDDASLTEIIVSHCNALGYPVDENDIEEEAYYQVDPIVRDKADLALLPVAYADNVVYALDKLLFPYPVAFSRASQATRYNKNGIPELVPANKPRLQHDPLTKAVTGYLCEPASTNVISHSENPSMVIGLTYWGNYRGYVPGFISGTYGPFNEFTLQENLGYTENRFFHGTANYTGTVPQTNTLTFQAKANGRSKIQMVNSVYVDLETGTLSGPGSATIKPVGDGWYEIRSTWTYNQNHLPWIMWIVKEFNPSNLNYEGDGVSGIKIRMLHNERSHFGTSYIPTYGSQATRLAESFDYSQLQAKQQQSNDKGSFFVDTKNVSAISGNTEFALKLLKGDDLINDHFAFSLSNNQWLHQYNIGAILSNVLSNTGTAEKIANQFANEVLKQYQNGDRVLDVAYIGEMYLNAFTLGGLNSAFELFTLAFFKESLLNAELAQLTS